MNCSEEGMMMDLFYEMRGKVAIVTGATSGIGHAAARLLAQQGMKVVAASRREKEGRDLQESIIAEGGEAVFVRTDVSDESSVKNMVEVALQKFGRLDYALNNAGVEGRLAPLVEMEESEFDHVMGINLKGVWLCLKHQLLNMNSSGAIVNISTCLTRTAGDGASIYTASKSGVQALTRAAAIEHGPKGIRVNAISPGAVDTPMIHRIYSDESDFSNLAGNNPLKKIATPQDIAHNVLWLLSPMSSHINGDVIFVDGGKTI